MAASEIDQKILGRIAKETATTNVLLSSALYQILGLSVQLSRKLFRARKIRRLDPTRDTRSLNLYHHITWLAREGLAITEVFILPYCQNGGHGPHCRVMAAKLRASFYHVCCLFHNNPPVHQHSPKQDSPKGAGAKEKETRARKAALREAIPSMTSETSYVTNPYAFDGPAQTPPPSYPVPPIPTMYSPNRRTPTLPPGLNIIPPDQPSPPSSANFLLPPIDFVPAASKYFDLTAALAKQLLSGSDPLRLSVTVEHCAFIWDCAKDPIAARERARQAVRDVYASQTGMDDAEFEDAAALVQAIAVVARRSENSSPTSQGGNEGSNTRSRGVPSLTQRSAKSSPSKRSVSRTQVQRPANLAPPPLPTPLRSPDGDTGVSMTEGRSTTLAESSKLDKEGRPETFSVGSARRSRASSKATQRPSLTSKESDKERKRRILERAEEQVRRRNSAKRAESTGSRQSTPLQMIGGQAGGKENVASRDFAGTENDVPKI